MAGNGVPTDFTVDKSAQSTLADARPGSPFPSQCPGTLKSLTFRWSLPPAWGGAMREAMSFHGHAALAGSSWQFALVKPRGQLLYSEGREFLFASVRVYNSTKLVLQVESKSDRSIFSYLQVVPTIRAKSVLPRRMCNQPRNDVM